MYSLLLCFKSMEVDKELDFEERNLLLMQGLTGKSFERPKPASAAWLTDLSWTRVLELEELNKGPWVNFANDFEAKIAEWRKVFDSDDPAEHAWPISKESMTALQRGLVLLAVRADCAVAAMQQIIAAKL